MKKNLLLIVLSFVAFSCSNDEETPEPSVLSEQRVVAGFLKAANFNNSVNAKSDIYEDYGMRFIPISNGVIKSIEIELPYADENIRVTLWDVASQTVLFSEIFDKVPRKKIAIKNITPYKLIKNKEYMISYLSNQCYLRYDKVEGTNVQYPILVGDVSVQGFNAATHFYGEIDNTFFPWPSCDASGHCQYWGNLDFVFQKTE